MRHAAALTDLPGEYAIADVPRGGRPEPGVQTIGDGRRITVNVDPRESATAALSAGGIQGDDRFSGRAPTSRRLNARRDRSRATQNLWRYGLLLMLAALVGESVVGRAT